jgi:hypothetical protein
VQILFRSDGTLEPIPIGGMILPHSAAGQLHAAFAVSREEFGAWERQLIARGITIESKAS